MLSIPRSSKKMYKKIVLACIVTTGLVALSRFVTVDEHVLINVVLDEKPYFTPTYPNLSGVCEEIHQSTSVQDLLCMKTPKFLKNYKNPCWMDNSTLRCQPYFHLIGNAKCGTSDFYRRLTVHPDILYNKGFIHKETSYWSRQRFGYIHGAHGGHYENKKDFHWFTDKFNATGLQNFKDKNGFHYKVTGVGDPMDFYDRFHDDMMPQNQRNAEELKWTTPHALRHLNPNIKLILILRDPIERLYSHYFHGAYGNSSESFHNHTMQSINLYKDCLTEHSERHCAYSRKLEVQYDSPIYPGFYNIHLREWLNAFPRDQFMIFRNEDFAEDAQDFLLKTFMFLDIDIPDNRLLKKMSKMPRFRMTPGKYRAGPMLNKTREILVEFYKPYLDDLAKLLDDDRYLFQDSNF